MRQDTTGVNDKPEPVEAGKTDGLDSGKTIQNDKPEPVEIGKNGKPEPGEAGKNSISELEKVALREKLSYGGVQFASCIYLSFSAYYLMGFLTDFALLPSAATSALLLFVRLFSAAGDQAAGIFINRVNLKGGKYRPWFRAFAVPYAVCVAAVGFSPDVSVAGKIVYAAAALILCELFRSLLGISALSMLPYIARGDAARAKFVSYSNACAILAFIVIGTLMMPLARFLGGGNMRAGFSATMALFAAAVIPLCLCAYTFLKEEKIITAEVKPPLKSVYLALLGNKRLMLFYAGFCVYYMADSFRSQTAYFYVTYNLGRPELLPVIIMAGLLSPLAMQPIIPRLLALASKEALAAFGILGASAVGFILLAFSGYPYALIIAAVFYGVFTAIFGNLNYAVLASFADEMQKRNNMHMSDILAATSTLFYKLGIAVASGAAPFVMWLTHYSAQAPAQAPAALTGIKTLYIICNASGLAIAGVIMIFVKAGAREKSGGSEGRS